MTTDQVIPSYQGGRGVLTLVEKYSRQGTWLFSRMVCAYSAKQNGVVVAEGRGAFVQTTSSMCMEMKAISGAIV